jgi:hypothetical protein
VGDRRRLFYVLLFAFIVVLGELNADFSWGPTFTLGVATCAFVVIVLDRVARR